MANSGTMAKVPPAPPPLEWTNTQELLRELDELWMLHRSIKRRLATLPASARAAVAGEVEQLEAGLRFMLESHKHALTFASDLLRKLNEGGQ